MQPLTLDNPLSQHLLCQKKAFEAEPWPSLEQRLQRLDRLKKMLINNREALIASIHQDFGGRSRQESIMADLMPVISEISYVRRHLKRWMKPQKRKVDWLYQPASARVIFQPLGVIGIMVPWNYPLQLALSPLISALAAGNRALLKMSELTPATSALLQQCIQQVFNPAEVQVITGDVQVSRDFARLPFDHLLFTGSTAVGHQIQQAAAEHLTPVTLELGGKSPAILDPDANPEQLIKPLVFGKTLNAGQTCIAPDYLLCPEHLLETTLQAINSTFASFYPSLEDNPDYTAIINATQRQRLLRLRDEALAAGTRHIVLNPASEDLTESNKLPLTLLVNPPESCTVMQQEIFGPLLPIITYTDFDQALQFIRSRPRPLALYYLGHDQQRIQQVERRTHSGGLCINETLLHVAQHDLPFGGIGASGMGCYHGREGFQTFSACRSQFVRRGFNSTRLVYPPYGRWIHRLLERLYF